MASWEMDQPVSVVIDSPRVWPALSCMSFEGQFARLTSFSFKPVASSLPECGFLSDTTVPPAGNLPTPDTVPVCIRVCGHTHGCLPAALLQTECVFLTCFAADKGGEKDKAFPFTPSFPRHYLLKTY